VTFAPMNSRQRDRVRRTRKELESARLVDEVERVKALDQERIRSGEMKASDLHLIGAQLARNAKVTWNFGRPRPKGGEV
jgi:hypothetical protein